MREVNNWSEYIVVQDWEVADYLKNGYRLYGNMTTVTEVIQGNYGPDLAVTHYQAVVR